MLDYTNMDWRATRNNKAPCGILRVCCYETNLVHIAHIGTYFTKTQQAIITNRFCCQVTCYTYQIKSITLFCLASKMTFSPKHFSLTAPFKHVYTGCISVAPSFNYWLSHTHTHIYKENLSQLFLSIIISLAVMKRVWPKVTCLKDKSTDMWGLGWHQPYISKNTSWTFFVF